MLKLFFKSSIEYFKIYYFLISAIKIKTAEKFILQRYTIYLTCASDKVKKFTDKPVNYIMQKQLYLR